jgi:hypothetical protein
VEIEVDGMTYYAAKCRAGLFGGGRNGDSLTAAQRCYIGLEDPFRRKELTNGWRYPSDQVLESWAALPPQSWELSLADRSLLAYLMGSDIGTSITDELERKRGGQPSWG